MLHRMRWLLLSALVALTACSTEGTPQGTLVLSIRGLPEGASPSIVLKGPKELVLNGPGSFPVPVGTYTLEARDVVLPSGERYYAEQVTSPIEVKRGQKANAEVVYALDRNSLPGELVLLIEGLPEGAEAAVSVEGGGQRLQVKASSTLRLKAGTYLVRASRVSYGGRDYLPTPAQASVDLEAGGRKTHTVSYAPEVKTGELLVNITGLPSGTEARVRVLDGSGTSVASLTKSRLLTLPAGTYFVEADPVGSYTPTVSGSPVQVQVGARAEVQVAYQNRPASLSLTLEPTSLTIPRGATGTLRATLTPQNFQGEVGLSLQGAPSGVSVSPGTVQVSGPTQATLTLSVGTGVAPGTYPITLTAQGQGVSASAGFSLVVPQPDFTFSLSPQSVSVSQGQSATLIASVSPQNGFSGQISFSLVNPPAGFNLSGGPVSPSGPVDVPLTLSVASSVAPGTYSLVVKAEGGGVVRTVSLQVQVQASTGQLAVVISGLPDGLEGNVEVRNSQGGLVSVLSKSQVLALPPDTYFISAQDVRDGQGNTYRGSVNGSPATVQAGQRVQVSVSYTLLPRPGFTLSASPSTLNIPKGGMGNTTLTITPQNGFSGTVELSLEGAPEGVSLSPTSLQVTGTAPVNQTLTLTVAPSVAPGTYTLQVKATSGSLGAQAALTLVVPAPSFAFAVSPTSLSIVQGSTGTFVASLQSQNGFSGDVSFSLVSPPAGFTLSGGPYRLESGEAVDVPLFLQVDPSVEPGSYSLVVQAESGSLTKRATLQVQVASRTGQLALGIFFQGAPAGAQGYVVVSGPGGTYTLTQSQVLSLAPGIYTITAYSVSVDGVPYDPSPPGGTVEVVAGGQASFTVTYTPRSGGGAP